MPISNKYKHGDLVYIDDPLEWGKVVIPCNLVSPRDTRRYRSIKINFEPHHTYVLVKFNDYIESYIEESVKDLPNAVKVLFGKN